MWEEEFQGQEMYPLRYIGISKDGKGDFAVFLYWRGDACNDGIKV